MFFLDEIVVFLKKIKSERSVCMIVKRGYVEYGGYISCLMGEFREVSVV